VDDCHFDRLNDRGIHTRSHSGGFYNDSVGIELAVGDIRADIPDNVKVTGVNCERIITGERLAIHCLAGLSRGIWNTPVMMMTRTTTVRIRMEGTRHAISLRHLDVNAFVFNVIDYDEDGKEKVEVLCFCFFNIDFRLSFTELNIKDIANIDVIG